MDWAHILTLVKIQEDQGLHFRNKLTERHIHIKDNKINVRLATQILSNSDCEALLALERKEMISGCSVQGTAEFCKTFNDAFDILNCKQRYDNLCRQPFKIPLCEENKMTLKKRAEEIEEYIRGLRHLVHPSNSKSKYTDRQHVTSGLRKCGFVGFIVCLRNIFELYEDLKEKYGFQYLLTYKLLQDMLESFFSAIRMRGGFTNNPICYQFQYPMRRLISRQQIVISETGNCLPDDIPILTVSSSCDQLTNPTDDPEDDDLLENE